MVEWDSYSRGVSTKNNVNGDSLRWKCLTDTKPRTVKVKRRNHDKNRVKIFFCSLLKKCSHGLRGQKENCMNIWQFNSDELRNVKVDHVKCRLNVGILDKEADRSKLRYNSTIHQEKGYNCVVWIEFEIDWYRKQQKTVMSNVALHRYMSSWLRKKSVEF